MTNRIRGVLGAAFALLLAVVPLVGLAAWFQVAGSTYTSPHHDYEVAWGSNWAALDRETASSDGVDLVVLSNNDGRLEIRGREGAAADEFLREQVAALGENVTIEAEDHAADVPFVELDLGRYHYRLEGYAVGDVVVVVTLRARESTYDAALASAQAEVTINGSPVLTGAAIAETEVATPVATVPVATPDLGTPIPTGESGLEGNTFTSPGFGFSLVIPDGWTVEREAISIGDEQLALGNGTSVVTVHATDRYTGDLAGCIAFASNQLEADPAIGKLRLSTTNDGEPYQGVDDLGAYGLFTYEPAEGEVMALFVRCQPLVEGESVLIITQQSPQEQYISERPARRQIQNAIELP